MTIAQAAPAWLVALLLLFLAIAAVEDGWRLRISNILVAAIALSGVAAIVIVGLGWAVWQPAVLMLALLAIGTPMFAAGWLGGGDVKLLAASGLWFTLSGGWRMLVMVAIAGGAVTLLILLLRRLPWSEQAKASAVALQRKGGIPYGIAIAMGVAATVLLARAAPPLVSALPLTSLTLSR